MRPHALDVAAGAERGAAPVIRSTPTSGSRRSLDHAAQRRRQIVGQRVAGLRRFSVMTATRSRIAQSSSVVPVSMVARWLSCRKFPTSVGSVIPGCPQDQTRNLEIPVRCFRIAPE